VAYAARDRHHPPRRLVWLLLVPSVLGGLVGALLLVYTNERNFTYLVPWLILGGTVLFVLEPRLSRRSSRSPSSRSVPTKLLPLAMAVTFAVAIFGGYFGVGIGILMISALSLFGVGDVGRVVPLKNLLTGFLRGLAVMVLIIEGVVNWSYGAPMVLGGLLGGYVGGMISGRTDRRFLRARHHHRFRRRRILLLERIRRTDFPHRRRITPRVKHPHDREDPPHVSQGRSAVNEN
jgi:uncharacterized membrane protein YfcA